MLQTLSHRCLSRTLMTAMLVFSATLTGCHMPIARPKMVPMSAFQVEKIATTQGAKYRQHHHRIAGQLAPPPYRVAVAHVELDRAISRYRVDSQYNSEVADGEVDATSLNIRLLDEHVEPLTKRFRKLEKSLQIESVFMLQSNDPAMRVEDLRAFAARHSADLLFAYSMNSHNEHNSIIALFSLLTLGLLPNHVGEADASGYGVLLEPNTGFVHAVYSLEKDTWQLANAYTASDAADDAEARARRRIALGLFKELEKELPLLGRGVPVVQSQRPPAHARILSKPRRPAPVGRRYETIDH